MDLQEIKEIIQREGGKIVIVENDRPQLIIMSFEEYKGYRGKVQTEVQNSPVADFTAPPPKTQQGEPKVNPYSPPRADRDQGEGLTIDDLPL